MQRGTLTLSAYEMAKIAALSIDLGNRFSPTLKSRIMDGLNGGEEVQLDLSREEAEGLIDVMAPPNSEAIPNETAIRQKLQDFVRSLN